MAEIKREITYINRKDQNGKLLEGHLIDDRHTIGDIARWLVANGWSDDVAYYLSNPEEL